MAKTMEYINSANKRYELATTRKEKYLIAKETGCKGQYVLKELPDHDKLLDTPVEPMHLIKNIAEHLIRLVTGIEDSVKVREEEKLHNRFRTAWVKKTKNKIKLPNAPFRLTKIELQIAK